MANSYKRIRMGGLPVKVDLLAFIDEQGALLEHAYVTDLDLRQGLLPSQESCRKLVSVLYNLIAVLVLGQEKAITEPLQIDVWALRLEREWLLVRLHEIDTVLPFQQELIRARTSMGLLKGKIVRLEGECGL